MTLTLINFPDLIKELPLSDKDKIEYLVNYYNKLEDKELFSLVKKKLKLKEIINQLK